MLHFVLFHGPIIDQRKNEADSRLQFYPDANKKNISVNGYQGSTQICL